MKWNSSFEFQSSQGAVLKSGFLFFLAVFGANEAAQMTVKTDSDWVFNRGEILHLFLRCAAGVLPANVRNVSG